MDKTEIYKKLNEIFRDVFDNNDLDIKESTSAADIEEWDSLTHITLIAEVEEAFDINFSMKDVLGFQNVGEMVAAITGLL